MLDFECNSLWKCINCKHREECKLFQRCFEGAIPSEVWRSVSCFDYLIQYVNEGGKTRMSRPLNSRKSWYKVYIKELNTPNIMKSECKYKCDYLLVKAYTGSVAMAIVQDYVVEFEENFRPVYYNKLEGGVPIDNKKVLFEEE